MNPNPSVLMSMVSLIGPMENARRAVRSHDAHRRSAARARLVRSHRRSMTQSPFSSEPSDVAAVTNRRASRSAAPSVLVVGSFSDGDMYAEYLRSLGCEVFHGRTPEEAFAYLDSRLPDVVVTDMVFEHSEFDGPEFVDAVRARPEWARLNVIVVSGFVRREDRQRARVAGADLFLTKPCAPESLWRHVGRAVLAQERNTRAKWNWPDEEPQSNG